MLNRAAVLIVCLTFGPPTTEPENDAPKPLTIAELNERTVVGQLGVPIGDDFEVEATIVDGSLAAMKALQGQFLLRVDRVNGRQLPAPVNVEFRVVDARQAGIAGDTGGLYELKMGKPYRGLSDGIEARLKRGYVGARYRVTLSERGFFAGSREQSNEGHVASATTSFRHFHTQMTASHAERIAEPPTRSSTPASDRK